MSMDVVQWKRGSTMSLIAKAEISDESHQPSEADEMVETSQEKPPPYILLERKARTTLEWFLGLVIMLLFCACAVLAAELAIMFVRLDQKETSVEVVDGILKATVAGTQICYTAECLQEASDILKPSNFRVNPCVDFHQYVCGGYEDSNAKNPPTANIVEDKIAEAQEKIRELLEEPSRYTDPITIRKIRNFYQSCVNIASIEERDVQPLQTLIDRIGGWPVVHKSSWKELESWQELVHRMQKANFPVNFFFEPRITFHPEHEFKLILGLSAAHHGLYSIGDESLHEEYYDRLVDAAVYFGAERSRAKQEMRYVFFFETMLKHRYWEEFNLNEMHILMNVSSLQTLEPSVNWTSYLNSFLPYRVRESDEIIVDSPQFIPRFTELLHDTDVRTLTNYAIARVVWNMAPLLTTKLKSIVGITSSASSSASKRYKECSDTTINYFSVPLASYYVTQHFSQETKKTAQDIIKYLKWSYHVIFDETQWDNDTISDAQTHIAESNLFIAHPEEILNVTTVDELYSSLNMNPQEYFENSRKIAMYLKERGMKLIRQSPEELENWQQIGGAALALDIMYFSRTNTTFIPAIILEDVFEISSKANYVNYASLGAIVAKEMAKGFRLSRGSENDISKNLGYPASDNMMCLAKQFRNFSEKLLSKPFRINSREIPWEEIEDYLDYFRGLKVAHQAYILWQQTKGWPELVLPGMNFTTNQLFWINYAHMFCSKPSKESFRYNSLDRSYIKNKLRVNIPVANLPQFAKDFQCSPDQYKLSPTNRCEAW